MSPVNHSTVCTCLTAVYLPDVHKRHVLHPPKLPGLPFNPRILQTLWAGAGLQRRVPRNDRHCISYRCVACNMHCAGYRLISGRHNIVSKPSYTAAKNQRIRIWTNCEKVRRFRCNLGICNNTSFYNVLAPDLENRIEIDRKYKKQSRDHTTVQHAQ